MNTKMSEEATIVPTMLQLYNLSSLANKALFTDVYHHHTVFSTISFGYSTNYAKHTTRVIVEVADQVCLQPCFLRDHQTDSIPTLCTA